MILFFPVIRVLCRLGILFSREGLLPSSHFPPSPEASACQLRRLKIGSCRLRTSDLLKSGNGGGGRQPAGGKGWVLFPEKRINHWVRMLVRSLSSLIGNRPLHKGANKTLEMSVILFIECEIKEISISEHNNCLFKLTFGVLNMHINRLYYANWRKRKWKWETRG